MKILNLKQNTPEWEDFRWDHIGASDCPVIMTGGEAAETLLKQKVFHQRGFTTDAMKRGSEMEAQAREWFNAKYSMWVEPTVFEGAKNWQIASVDGFQDLTTKYKGPVEDILTVTHVLLEIKCPGEATFAKIRKTKSPLKEWEWQIQHQLCVTGGCGVNLLVYSPTEQIEISVERDEAMIEMLLEAEERFFERMVRYDFRSPKIVCSYENLEKDFEEMADAKEAERAAKVKYEALKERVLAQIDQTVDQVTAGRFGFTKTRCKGNVDYAAIPQLQGVNLEAYRKEPIVKWSLSS